MGARPTWELLAELPVRIDDYGLEGLQADVSSDFTRRTTVIHLRGDGHEGVGEDVTYDAPDHAALQDAGPGLALAGTWTLASFSRHLVGLELFPAPPTRAVSRRYRTWAYESAALDLGLRQTASTLHQRLGRTPSAVRFVVSLRLGEPPSLDGLRALLAEHPGLRFKLDPTSSWDEPLIAALAATGAVDSVDLKGLYVGSVVDQPPDPLLYRRVVEALPQAWIEDPALTAETETVLAAHRDRFSWDAPLHSVCDIEALPHVPRIVNIKPSRLGGVRTLLDAYDHCARSGIEAYGGGQFELGPGRGQIQYLASLFHPDSPNDVAPAGYNAVAPGPGLPDSPLAPAPHPLGFRWG